MKIAIIGSRIGFSRDFVIDTLEKQKLEFDSDTIISGGAIGIDTYANEFAVLNLITFEIIRPIKENIGYGIKMNYIFRNIEILTKADKIIAFWDGKSRGTKSVIDYAKARNKDIEIIKQEKKQ